MTEPATEPTATKPDSGDASASPVSLLGHVCIAAVRGYQRLLSPLLGGYCRFRPTCSEYMILAIRRYGALRGVPRGVLRIARCNPLGGSGFDPP